MAIEIIRRHLFYRMNVQGHTGLERVMTNSSDCLILPAAVDFARDAYDGAPVELQSPEDAWIARLAQDPKNPTDKAAFDDQITRGLALVWFEKKKPVITIYAGIPHNLALTRAQEGYDSFHNTNDWQVPLDECRDILDLQKNRIRSHPGEHVELGTKKDAERDPLTQDMFGEATSFVAKHLSDKGCKTLNEYFSSTNGIKNGHARVRVVGLGGDCCHDLNCVYARRLFSKYGRARGACKNA